MPSSTQRGTSFAYLTSINEHIAAITRATLDRGFNVSCMILDGALWTVDGYFEEMQDENPLNCVAFSSCHSHRFILAASFSLPPPFCHLEEAIRDSKSATLSFIALGRSWIPRAIKSGRKDSSSASLFTEVINFPG